MRAWIRANPLAQAVGLLMHEFHLRFEDFEDMTALQYNFLLSWLEWHYERQKRGMKGR